jgi:hypothetical protein
MTADSISQSRPAAFCRSSDSGMSSSDSAESGAGLRDTRKTPSETAGDFPSVGCFWWAKGLSVSLLGTWAREPFTLSFWVLVLKRSGDSLCFVVEKSDVFTVSTVKFMLLANPINLCPEILPPVENFWSAVPHAFEAKTVEVYLECKEASTSFIHASSCSSNSTSSFSTCSEQIASISINMNENKKKSLDLFVAGRLELWSRWYLKTQNETLFLGDGVSAVRGLQLLPQQYE